MRCRRVLIATAAGREGINLQHARVLFNFDLPWNPMDVEQRIADGEGEFQLQVYKEFFTDQDSDGEFFPR